MPANAYLIIDGTQIYPLTCSVLNIGRRPDNQIVIDDPRVSRVHAQVRAIKGRFVIFDLDSKGGTFVNTQRVSQSTLFTGDVINLSGYPMVYGQDAQVSGATQKYSPDGKQ
jgi:pSer/pThr/pTyr-binding forkhead associated (FHA) protein